MKSLYRLLLLGLGFVGIFILLNYQTNISNKINHVRNHASNIFAKASKKVGKSIEDEVVICVVACGNDRLDESLTMLKSALIFSKRPLRFIVISDYDLIPAFHEKLTEWKQIVNKTFDFIVRPVTFPDISDVTMWRKLFKPCAAQRLFLPVSRIPSYHSFIYSIFVSVVLMFKIKPLILNYQHA
jgi:UDP-xylose:glucoside alpha-1,3-xylosyltransferase